MTDWDRSAGPPVARDRGAGVFLQVGAGILLVPLLHALVGAAMWGLVLGVDALGAPAGELDALRMVPILWLFGIGLGQLPYVIPVGVALAFVRRPIALGVAIGAALTLTLNGACFGLVFSGGLLTGL